MLSAWAQRTGRHGGTAVSRLPAVRVLWAGLHRGSPGPADITCAEAEAGSIPGRRARKIVAEFSDVGQSRTLARARCRPGRRAGWPGPTTQPPGLSGQAPKTPQPSPPTSIA